MKRLRLAPAALLGLLALLSLGIVSPAAAEEGALTLSAQVIEPGGTLDVSGGGFTEEGGISITLQGDGTVIDLGRVAADRSGSFSATVAVPADVAMGRYSLAAAGVAPDSAARILSAPLVVSDDPSEDLSEVPESVGVSTPLVMLLTAAITALVVSGIWVVALRRTAIRQPAPLAQDTPHQD